jgi:Domain of unknown function (DUF4062)
MPDPVVFISSTCEDLKDHREQAARAASANSFSFRMLEYFPASGHVPSVEACLEKVDEADVVVALIAHRYGWVPDGPNNPGHQSITWMECAHARATPGKEVLAFLVDPDYAWPPELKEEYRLVTERKKPGIGEEVERNEEKLNQFKGGVEQVCPQELHRRGKRARAGRRRLGRLAPPARWA